MYHIIMIIYLLAMGSSALEGNSSSFKLSNFLSMITLKNKAVLSN